MNDYLVMIYEGDNTNATPADWSKLLEGHAAYIKKLDALGVKKHSSRLRPVAEGRRASAAGVVDGPFAGDKEVLSACYGVRTKTLHDAVALAKDCPMLPNDIVEVRPLMGRFNDTREETQSGVFSCAVLGKAPDAKQWMALMDRIDRDTSDAFPQDSFVGGFRLESPDKAVRFDSHKQILDGPFAEGKEVLGGVCFMRFSSLDDATEWAFKKSAFMKDGTLEVRAVWPT